MFDEDVDFFDCVYGVWLFIVGGDGLDVYWCVSVFNELFDFDCVMVCWCVLLVWDDDGSWWKFDYVCVCVFLVVLKSVEIEILLVVVLCVDLVFDE